MSVTDSETLSVTIAPPAISENGGGALGTVTRSNTNISSALTVTLSSSDTTGATVPASVTIPANQASATFIVDAVNDALLDGVQTVIVTAVAAGYLDGSAAVNVTDDEQPFLLLSVSPSTFSENGGTATGTVTRTNANLSADLVVALSSSDNPTNGETTEASVPATVTIPAGQASVTFPVTALDDTLLDGTQSVFVLASAAGFFRGFVPGQRDRLRDRQSERDAGHDFGKRGHGHGHGHPQQHGQQRRPDGDFVQQRHHRGHRAGECDDCREPGVGHLYRLGG